MSREHPAEQLSRLWRQGQRPELADFLAGRAALPPGELVGVLHADQRQRWRAGQRIPAEDYLREFPAVASDPELKLDLVFSELRNSARSMRWLVKKRTFATRSSCDVAKRPVAGSRSSRST